MEIETSRNAFRALGDPTRLHIVTFLASMCCGRASLDDEGGVEGPTAGEICCHITGEQKISSTISHHLHELEDAGLIQIERRGKRMVCSLRHDALRQLAEFLVTLANTNDQTNCC